MIKPTFFPTQEEFRKWLLENHESKKELIVGFYKVKSGLPSMTWSQSVDQALCFGWIDGVRRSVDEKSYQIRYTPRRRDSVWSPVNLEKIEKLTKEGLMCPAGVSIYNSRKKDDGNAYGFRKKALNLPDEYEIEFKKNPKAWEYFCALAPSYKKLSIHWVISAVQEKTKLKRLNELISSSELQVNKWKDNKYKKK